ncbi:MAG: hypothetical protein JWP22_840 [Ramlibacter sp.]|nr:hypothetical protein [Ramlibacter sp.]
MLQPAATVTLLWLLQAKAKVESARVKIRPPWQIWCPLSMGSRTFMRIRARPGSQASSSICRKSLLAASTANSVAPTFAARSCGDSMLTLP